MSIGGLLDLYGTAIASLPDNLSVGGSLHLEGNAIWPPITAKISSPSG
jgi:hypothetical protein